MRRSLSCLALLALICALSATPSLAKDPAPAKDDEVHRFTLPTLSEDEARMARAAAPDAQSQLLAEVFPGARPEAALGMAPLRDDYAMPEGRGFLRLEGGAEVVDSRMGLRLGAGGSLYSADRRLGLRLDAATVQGDSQRELLKLLLSAGGKLGERDQLVFSAGWLNRYAWGSFDQVGEQGDDINQYVLGLELERQLRQRGEGTGPGVSAFLTALHFKSESKTVWSGARSGENDASFYRYFYEYGLGGGSQYESLAGLRFNWKRASLEMQAGFRHKEYEEYLGTPAKRDDAPKAAARLTLSELLGNEVFLYYTWDPDLQVAGAGVRRPLAGGWWLSARAEQVQGEDRPDDTRYFLGLDYAFGVGAAKPSPARDQAGDKMEKERRAEEDRGKAKARGDWLRPVRGSEVEYIQVMRQVQRKTRIWEVNKGGLPDGVTVDKKAGEIIVNGLPGVTAVVLVSPSAAWPAFTLSGGLLKIAIEKLAPGVENLCQLQQSDGRYSMVLLRTSRGSVIVDSVLYNTNLTECQVAAILSNPSLITNPPDPAPSIRTIPDQNGTINSPFSADLSAFVNGSGVKEYKLDGTLPSGLGFDTASGLLAGRPTQQGVFYLGLSARNGCGWSAVAPLTLIIGGSGDCSGTAIAISGWTVTGLPVPGVDNPVGVVEFNTNVAVSSTQITVSLTSDDGNGTAAVVNLDGGAGLQWRITGNLPGNPSATTITLTVTVRDACGRTATNSRTALVGN